MSGPLGLALVLYLSLGFATIAVREAFHDEGQTYDQVSGPLPLDRCAARCTVASLLSSDSRAADVIHGLRERGLHPPAYYLLLHAWSRLVGSSLPAFRSLGLLMGALVIVALARLGRCLLASQAGGSWAAMLAAASPWLVQMGAYARPYAMATALAAWSSLLLVRAGSSDRRAAWLAGYVVLSVAGLYTVYHYAFVMVAQSCAWLARGPGRARWRVAAVGSWVVAALLAYAPWIGAFRDQLRRAMQPEYFSGRVPFLDWPLGLLRLAQKLMLADVDPSLADLLGAPLLLAALAGLWAMRRRPAGLSTWLWYTGGLALSIGVADALFDAHTLFNVKHAFGFYPALLVCLAGPVVLSKERAGRAIVAFTASLLAGTCVLRVVREVQIESDLERVVAWVRRGGDEAAQLVVTNHATRGYLYPLLLALDRAGLRSVRVASADRDALETVVAELVSRGARRITLVEFRKPPGPDQLRWRDDVLAAQQQRTRAGRGGPQAVVVVAFRQTTPRSLFPDVAGPRMRR